MIITKRIVIAAMVFFLTILVFWGCDSIPGDVLDSPEYDESVVTIETPSNVAWTMDDSSFTVSVTLRDDSQIESLLLNIINKSGQNEIGMTFQLLDNGNAENGDENAGDNIYSAKPYMLATMANGTYYAKYSKISQGMSEQNIAAVAFEYDNGQRNYPPVISDLVMPANIRRGNDFVISLKASDPNGLANLQGVVFKLTRPDGTASMNGNSEYFPMFDDGNTQQSGDETRGDGIFSLKNSFLSSSQTGTWTFEFKAIDKEGAESNIIIQNMRVD